MSMAFALQTFQKLKRLRLNNVSAIRRYKELDDEALLALCLDGDGTAMGIFVARYDRYIRTVVGRTVRKYTTDVDSSVIDDLCQEVFVSLFEKDRRRLRLFEGRNGCPLRAWLRVIAMRTTISRMRRWKKHTQLPNEDTDRGSIRLVDDGLTATQMLAAQDELSRKNKLLALAKNLGPDDRQLIEMLYVQELSVPEITKRLRIRRGALYMRKNRALVRLRAHARAAGLM